MWNYNANGVAGRQRTLDLTSFDHAYVIGVGGIGSWVAFNLALSGMINIISVYDDDVVETSNLNRTPFRLCDIGRLKVVALSELILERRPTQKMVIVPEKFTDETKLPSMNSVIFDCRDDIYNDIDKYNCKKWKLGYDGMEVTIDGDPSSRTVWGQSDGYSVTPSFFAPAQMAATIAPFSEWLRQRLQTKSELARFSLPGIPPGNIMAENSFSATEDNSQSLTKVIACAPLTEILSSVKIIKRMRKVTSLNFIVLMTLKQRVGREAKER